MGNPLNEAADTLNDSLWRLGQEWRITLESWRDANREAFEQSCWQPVERQTARMCEEMTHLGQLIDQAIASLEKAEAQARAPYTP